MQDSSSCTVCFVFSSLGVWEIRVESSTDCRSGQPPCSTHGQIIWTHGPKFSCCGTLLCWRLPYDENSLEKVRDLKKKVERTEIWPDVFVIFQLEVQSILSSWQKKSKLWKTINRFIKSILCLISMSCFSMSCLSFVVQKKVMMYKRSHAKNKFLSLLFYYLISLKYIIIPKANAIFDKGINENLKGCGSISLLL